MNHAIILSGGIGSRMKEGVPKQYLEYRGQPIICYCLETFNAHPLIGKIVIVAHETWQEKLKKWAAEHSVEKLLTFASPGENRQLSIKSGLMALRGTAAREDAVIIHDAARPFVSADLISRCLDALPGYDGVMPYLPAKDTYYLIGQDGVVSRRLPRASLAAGQAPEVFLYGKYLDINEAVPYDEIMKINGSTELALQYGLNVRTVSGEERNFKITTKDDLFLMDRYLEEPEN